MTVWDFAALAAAAQVCTLCASVAGRRRVLGAANGNPTSPLLFVAEARGYGCEVPYDLNTVYDRAILLQVIGDTTSRHTWPRQLRAAGYTHLLYNPIELDRYRKTFEAEGWKEGARVEQIMEVLEQSGGLQLIFTTHPTPAGQVKVYEIRVPGP